MIVLVPLMIMLRELLIPMKFSYIRGILTQKYLSVGSYNDLYESTKQQFCHVLLVQNNLHLTDSSVDHDLHTKPLQILYAHALINAGPCQVGSNIYTCLLYSMPFYFALVFPLTWYIPTSIVFALCYVYRGQGL